MGADVKQDVISVSSVTLTVTPGAGVHTDPGLRSAAPIRRVTCVLLTHVPFRSACHRRNSALSRKTTRSTAERLTVQCTKSGADLDVWDVWDLWEVRAVCLFFTFL